jgi:hypothetical protein
MNAAMLVIVAALMIPQHTELTPTPDPIGETELTAAGDPLTCLSVYAQCWELIGQIDELTRQINELSEQVLLQAQIVAQLITELGPTHPTTQAELLALQNMQAQLAALDNERTLKNNVHAELYDWAEENCGGIIYP